MYHLELKYGFLTCYKSTFFLKHENIQGIPVLSCSDPMEFDQESRFGKDPDVSVRE